MRTRSPKASAATGRHRPSTGSTTGWCRPRTKWARWRRNTREGGEADQAEQEAGKIGKSKGAAAFRELLQKFPGETIRFFILSTHYRRPIDYSDERIREVQGALEGFYRFFGRFERVTGESFYALPAAPNRAAGEIAAGDGLLTQIQALRDAFLEAMDDDFNTGGAIGELFNLLGALNRFVEGEGLDKPGQHDAGKVLALRTATTTLRELAAMLGLFKQPVVKQAAGDERINTLLGELVKLRKEARGAKNFALADKIRKSLGEIGVTLEDRPDGTVWTIKPLADQLQALLDDANKAK